VVEDKTGTEHVVQVANTKTILKVLPTAKDLKSAVRITAGDLQAGDRVDVRGSIIEGTPGSINAHSVILMSARDLAKTHEEQAAAWTHATSGRAMAVDTGTGKISAEIRDAGAMKPMTVDTTASTQFLRYSAESGKGVPSQLGQIQVGDQLKIVGEKNADETAIEAQKVYSGAFRTMAATIAAIAPDGKTLTVKNLANKQNVTVVLGADVGMHKLPPMMAAILARRLNPAAAGAMPNGSRPSGAGGPPAGEPPAGMPASGPPNGMPGAPGGRANGGDMSQMIDRTPTITLADLKPGDAVVIAGVEPGADPAQLVANTIIAGVEPILQAAPARRGASGANVGGDWGLGEMSAPQQ
jgi:hypothetical protein